MIKSVIALLILRSSSLKLVLPISFSSFVCLAHVQKPLPFPVLISGFCALCFPIQTELAGFFETYIFSSSEAYPSYPTNRVFNLVLKLVFLVFVFAL